MSRCFTDHAAGTQAHVQQEMTPPTARTSLPFRKLYTGKGVDRERGRVNHIAKFQNFRAVTEASRLRSASYGGQVLHRMTHRLRMLTTELEGPSALPACDR